MSTIKWNPLNAKINDIPGTMVVGSPGAGKSFYILNQTVNKLVEENYEHNKMESNDCTDGK